MMEEVKNWALYAARCAAKTAFGGGKVLELLSKILKSLVTCQLIGEQERFAQL
ncbi:hypothetical protein [Candidatus Tokpelaia sp.]|uniref:hypothetical protein n=1 Tax=Candidatus Tokpelaia sp. TaxID=2233777 RepID=UPI00167FEE34|nr:hypothetical protein [Candidatus Tokpelaia sp.]